MSVIARGRHCVKSSLFLPCARFSSDAKKKLSTVDIEEVQKFSDAAADWWGNKDAGNTNAVGPLHKMNPVRVNYICRRVRERFGNDGSLPLSGLRVLDVGCGGGILSESLGGNSKTLLIITCSPHPFNDSETLSTLRFGARARNIKNAPKVNKEYTVPELKRLLEKSGEKIEALKKHVKILEKQILNSVGSLPD